jgi:hypothetical protein
MNETSVIVQPISVLTNEEFKALDRYSELGRVWTLVRRLTSDYPFICRRTTIEYVFDSEALILFFLITKNVIATWDTEKTKYLKDDEEYHIKPGLYIQPYNKKEYEWKK